MGRRKHLTKEERLVIQVGLESKRNISAIAKELSRSKSCISKEIHNNTDPTFGHYNYLRADNIARERQNKAKTGNYKISKIPKEIMDKLFDSYMGVHELSPDDAAYKLRVEEDYRISYSSLYRHIYRNKVNGGKLFKYLPRKGKRHKKAKYVRVNINNKVMIDNRPVKEILLLEAGHWEIDTIFGKDQESFLLTLVDIATMYTIIVKLDNKAANTVEQALLKIFGSGFLPLTSITSDNGGEFACHNAIKQVFGIKWYFCHPYCSWERGLNENTNGLIRRSLPKGTDFNKVSNEEIRMIQNNLNARYRKRIGRLTPTNKMVEMVQQAA